MKTWKDVTELISKQNTLIQEQNKVIFDKYGNYKYPSDVELSEPNMATSLPSGDLISIQVQKGVQNDTKMVKHNSN